MQLMRSSKAEAQWIEWWRKSGDGSAKEGSDTAGLLARKEEVVRNCVRKWDRDLKSSVVVVARGEYRAPNGNRRA